jgi:hypothetical protein
VRPGREADPSPSFSAEVKNRVELSLRAFVDYGRVKPTYLHISIYTCLVVFLVTNHQCAVMSL